MVAAIPSVEEEHFSALFTDVTEFKKMKGGWVLQLIKLTGFSFAFAKQRNRLIIPAAGDRHHATRGYLKAVLLSDFAVKYVLTVSVRIKEKSGDFESNSVIDFCFF